MSHYYTYTPLTAFELARASDMNARFEQVDAAFETLPQAELLAQARPTYAAATGTGDAMVAALPKALTAYAAGVHLALKAPATNTGPATVNVDGLGAVPITRSDLNPLAAGDILSGSIIELRHDGTAFRLVSGGALYSTTISQAAASAASAAASAAAAAQSAIQAAASAALAASYASSIDPASIVRVTGDQVIGGAKTFTSSVASTSTVAGTNLIASASGGAAFLGTGGSVGSVYFGSTVDNYLRWTGSAHAVVVGGTTRTSVNSDGLAVTGSYYLNGVALAGTNTSYHLLYNQGGTPSIVLGGPGDPVNFYDNTTHTFRSRDTAVAFATLNSTGLAVTGTLSATSNISSSAGLLSVGSAPLLGARITSVGDTNTNSTVVIQNTNGAASAKATLLFGNNNNYSGEIAYTSSAYSDPNALLFNTPGPQIFYVSSTEKARVTSAGLAVTGALSCTGNATIGDGSGDSHVVNGAVTINHSLVSKGNPLIANANPVLQLYNAAQDNRWGYIGHNASDLDIVNEEGGTVRIFTNGANNVLVASTGVTLGGGTTVLQESGVARGHIQVSSAVCFSVNDAANSVSQFNIHNSNGMISLRTPSTTANAANLYHSGGGVDNLLRSTSSLKYKTQVETIDPARNKVLDLRPVWYRSLAEADNPAWGFWGLIAEEVAAIDKKLVHFAFQDDQYETVEVEPATEAVLDADGNEVEPARPAVSETRVKAGEVKQPDGVQYERLAVLLLDVVKRHEVRLSALEDGGPL